MSFIIKIHYILNKNSQDIILFKDYFINKLNWSNDQYERIKQDTFNLKEDSFILTKQFDENHFWILAKNIESLYIFINDEINLSFNDTVLIEKEEIYKYYIRLQGLISDINSLRKVYKKFDNND